MLQQAGDSVGGSGVNQRVAEFFVHDAAGQARENTHMLVARGVFVKRQHNDELRLVISPAYRRVQARHADGGLFDMFRFAVRNGKAKAQSGGEYRLARPC